MGSLARERMNDGVEVVRLDRPERRNALDSGALAELLGVLDELAADASLGALVFSTTDARGFCAGADVAEELDHEGGVRRMEAFARVYAAVEAFPAPTVCVCVGNVVGAGAEIAAGCDLRVGGDNLKLAWAGARLGVPVGPARLAPLIGESRARDLVLTGRVVGVDEALALGFVNRVAPAGEAEAVAVELASLVAANDREGVRRLKRMFRAFEGLSVEQRVARENEILVDWQRRGAGLPGGGVPRD